MAGESPLWSDHVNTVTQIMCGFTRTMQTSHQELQGPIWSALAAAPVSLPTLLPSPTLLWVSGLLAVPWHSKALMLSSLGSNYSFPHSPACVCFHTGSVSSAYCSALDTRTSAFVCYSPCAASCFHRALLTPGLQEQFLTYRLQGFHLEAPVNPPRSFRLCEVARSAISRPWIFAQLRLA